MVCGSNRGTETGTTRSRPRTVMRVKNEGQGEIKVKEILKEERERVGLRDREEP